MPHTKNAYTFTLFMLLCTFSFPQAFGQGKVSHKEAENEKIVIGPALNREYYNKVELGIGLVYVPNAETFQGNPVLIPTITAEYQHWYYRRIGTLLQVDVELGSYLFTFDDVEVDREDLVVAVLSVIVEPIERTVVVVGLGNEIGQKENFPVFRAGVFYDIPVGKHWAFAPAFYYDYKYAYSSYTFEVAFGYWFGRTATGGWLNK
jgi:hypothetical protein